MHISQISDFCERKMPSEFLELFVGGLRRGAAQRPAMCMGAKLCGAAPEAPICELMYSSGDLKRPSHPCAVPNGWDEECVREACAAVSACAGYMRSLDGRTYWLFGAPIKAVESANDNYRCFARRGFEPPPPPPLPTPFSKPPPPPPGRATRRLAYSVSAHEGFNLQLNVAQRLIMVLHHLGPDWQLELMPFANADHWRRERTQPTSWAMGWSAFFRVDRLPVHASEFGEGGAGKYTVLHLGKHASAAGAGGPCTCRHILQGASKRRGEFACDETDGVASVRGVGFPIGGVRCVRGEGGGMLGSKRADGAGADGLDVQPVLHATDVARAVASLDGAPARVFLHAAESMMTLRARDVDELQLHPTLWVRPSLQRRAHRWLQRRRVRPESTLAFHARRGDYILMSDRESVPLPEWPARIAERVAQAEREAAGNGTAGYAIESVIIATDGAAEIRSALAPLGLLYNATLGSRATRRADGAARWVVHLFDDGGELEGVHEGERAIIEQWSCMLAATFVPTPGSFFSLTIENGREAMAHTLDHDLRAGMPFVHSLPDVLRTPWLVRCGDGRRYDAYAIEATLAEHDGSRALCLGVLVRDEVVSVIHHYDPVGSGRAYPLLEACVALSAPLVEQMRPHLPWKGGNSDFSIDPAYELSKMVERVGGVLVHEPRLLLVDETVSGEPSPSPTREEGEAQAEQCDSRATTDGAASAGRPLELVVGVKTTGAYHNTRIPAWRRLSMGRPPAGAVYIFSESDDASVPTVAVPVPNVDNGHCEKLRWILGWMAERSAGWTLIVDDDTWLNYTALYEHLAWRELELSEEPSDLSARPIVAGERYRQSIVDYPTGGAGMLFNRAAVSAIARSCTCARVDSFDDIWVGTCARQLGIDIAHIPRFHQARPSEYHRARLQLERPHVSFHKTMAFTDDDHYLLATEGGEGGGHE